MSAFHSSTDNADDKSGIRFSGVFGKLDQPEAMTVWRFNYMEKKFEAKISDIFEEPPKEQQAIPADWLGKIKVQAPALRVTRGPSSVTGASTGRWSAHGSMYGYTQQQLNYARTQRESAKRNYQDFNGDFWGFGTDAYDDLYGEMETKVTGKAKTSPKIYDIDDAEDFKSLRDPFSTRTQDVTEVRGQYIDDTPVGEPAEEYQKLAEDYGPDAADAFWDIQQCIVMLENSEDLLTSVVEEACGMMKDPHAKLKAMRAIYESLDEGSRDSVATNGL
jgi:hypothetical protein